MVMAHRVPDRRVVLVSQKLIGVYRMLLDDLVFLFGQFSRRVKDLLRDLRLADIVEQSRHDKQLDLLLRHFEPVAHHAV